MQLHQLLNDDKFVKSVTCQAAKPTSHKEPSARSWHEGSIKHSGTQRNRLRNRHPCSFSYAVYAETSLSKTGTMSKRANMVFAEPHGLALGILRSKAIARMTNIKTNHDLNVMVNSINLSLFFGFNKTSRLIVMSKVIKKIREVLSYAPASGVASPNGRVFFDTSCIPLADVMKLYEPRSNLQKQCRSVGSFNSWHGLLHHS